MLRATSFAQLNRANAYYESAEYAKAIPHYLKALKKGDNAEAVKKLAHCYRLIRNYQQAELYYARAAELSTEEADIYLLYAEALKNNKKLDEAKDVYLVYSSKNPADKEAGKYALSVDKIKAWSGDEALFSVSNLKELNTPFSEFCAVPYLEGLVFVSERNADLLNMRQYEWTERPYLSIFYARKNGSGYRKPRPFSRAINTENHNGPIAFSKEAKEAIFTSVEPMRTLDKQVTSWPQLYTTVRKGKSWKQPKPFAHNSSDYSLAHPCLSPDGNTLYFSSDMPGGQGGMDIYSCTREGQSWGKPQNLGPEINTPRNEMFPYVHEDGTLYFSSNGHTGYGGLDIFSAKGKDGKWGAAENLRAPLNSSTDDFGIFFQDAMSGYFSSDRAEGLGSDDLYSFKMLKPREKEKTTIKGIFFYSKLSPAPNVKLKLLNEQNEELQTVTTNLLGEFEFKNLPIDEGYLILIAEGDAKISEQARIYLTNATGGKVIELTQQQKKGLFAFTSLAAEKYNSLPLLALEDESLLTIRLLGQIYQKLPGDYPNGVPVYIVNDEGEVLFTTLTDARGFFSFDKLPPDQAYIIHLREQDSDAKILILNEKGAMLEALKSNAKGMFRYERLAADEAIITLLDEKDALIKIRPDDNFIITNIYYDYNSADINETAGYELDKLVKILAKNPHIGVDLSSHTDSRGDDKYNLELSDKRAKTAVEYVLAKGIAPQRVSGKGYGESKLVNKCDDGVDCSDEEHQQNRRTEFTIVKVE